MNLTINEPARSIPVDAEVDLCIVGGSVTGLAAAVAAARLGLSTAIVELGGMLGGNTTLGLVSVWHSFWNTTGDRQVIAGLSQEIVERLRKREAVVERPKTDPGWQFALAPAEVACELDALATEHGIRLFLHARAVAVHLEDGAARAVVIEDEDGRRAIRAKYFIDASGDADLVRLAGGAVDKPDHLQPPTTAAIIEGLGALGRAVPGFRLSAAVFDQAHPLALRPGFLWSVQLPGSQDLTQVFGTRAHGADCATAAGLTRAEVEGRRQVRQMLDLLKAKHPEHALRLIALPARCGIRETRHARCLHRLTETEVLHGQRFDDAIANGSYRVDVHQQDGDGLIFRYLDGREVVARTAAPSTQGRWREPIAVDPTFYQIPYRSLVPVGLPNILVAGRCLDADQGAFGAVRVQVNCNQMGEAAGTAAAIACRRGIATSAVDAAELRRELAAHGAAVV